MRKPGLLYISINDGSDTRINKEIKTLAAHFQIYYIGIGKTTEKAFVKTYCKSFQVVQGHHKSIAALLKFYLLFLKLFFSHSFQSVHVINEPLLLIFYPFLFFKKKNLVLDIFDSIFLRASRQMEFLKKITYQLPAVILVTDNNRKSLMPAQFQHKIAVLENYPYRYTSIATKPPASDKLTIFYNGSMSKARGTEILQNLLKLSSSIEVKMAGWIYDQETRELSMHSQVNYLGVVTQQESMKVASECDYILSLYEPKNENNINASPNKIYDAIQARTPVIINAEVKIAGFVKEQSIGYVTDSFYTINHRQLLQDLIRRKGSFTFSPELQHTFTWEAIEYKLLQAHRR
jgi:hypothetical protein